MPLIKRSRTFVSTLLRREVALFILLTSVFIALSFRFLADFASPGLNLYLAIMALPFCFVVQQKGVYSFRYGLLSLLMATCYLYLQVQTFYFLSFCCLILFAIEQSLGKVGRLPFMIAIAMSPVIHYFLNVGSFPIRLQMSATTAWLVSFVYENTYAEGNLIYTNGQPYEVEPACLGLGMLVTGLILGMAVLAHFEHKAKQSMNRGRFVIWLAILSILIVASNLFRILGLVLFKVPPEVPAHDLIGILSLVIYAIAPLWWLTPKLLQGKLYHSEKPKPKKRPFLKYLILAGVAALSFKGTERYHFRRSLVELKSANLPAEITGFVRTEPHLDVVRFANAESVIFYKPCVSFYNGTHSPAICWRGSGFSLKNEHLINLEGIDVMAATLEKNGAQFYTCWWYESEEKKTISQLEWRWDMLISDRQYNLVNVSAHSKEKLLELTLNRMALSKIELSKRHTHIKGSH